MSYSTVTYACQDHIARLTLNRPGEDNVVNQELAQEMADACARINQDDGVHVVIVTGAGDRAFCAGGQMERLAQVGKARQVPLAEAEAVSAQYDAARSVSGINCPVIAAINGVALGQGLELALSGDIRIAATGASFGLPQVASGLIPMGGGTQRLPRLVGRAKALELILTGDTVGADEALAMGLVSKVVPPEKLLAEAEALARSIATKAPFALRFAKEAVSKGMDLTLEQGLRLEADLYLLLQTTWDRTEGIKAFLEKRPPQFRGQ